MKIFDCPSDILGNSCRDLKIRVVTQQSRSLVTELKPISGSFNRVVDGTSAAQITAQVPTKNNSSGGSANCCEDLSNLSIGRQELEFLFNDTVVWAGPVTNLAFAQGAISVSAEDYSHVWRYRLIDESVSPIQQDVSKLVEIYHNAALSKDPIPNFNLVTFPAGEFASSSVTGSDPQTAFDLIAELSDFSIDFTAFGRNMIVGPPSAFPTLPICLTDKHFDTSPTVSMLGPNDGFATRIIAYSQDGADRVIVQASPAIIAVYGIIERVVTFEQITSRADLTKAALAYLNTFKNPFYISPIAGSVLSPWTPIAFNQLIAGAKVKVAIKNGCKPITSIMRISEVSFNILNKRTLISLEPTSGEFGGDQELSEIVS